MKNKSFIFLCFCALLLISVVSTEPFEDEKQVYIYEVGEIGKSRKNIGQGSSGIVIPFTGSGGNNANELLYLDCEKDGGSGNSGGGSGNGDCDGEEGGGVKKGDRKKEGCNGKPPVRHYPDIGMGYGCGSVISIPNSEKRGDN